MCYRPGIVTIKLTPAEQWNYSEPCLFFLIKGVEKYWCKKTNLHCSWPEPRTSSVQDDIDNRQITMCLLNSYIFEITPHLVWHNASWRALLLHAFCFWEGMPKPCSNGRLLRILRSSCPQPNESDPRSQDVEADKAFCRKTSDKKDDFGEQANHHVGPHLCGNLWKCFSYMHKNTLLGVALSNFTNKTKKTTPKFLFAYSGNSTFTRHLTI